MFMITRWAREAWRSTSHERLLTGWPKRRRLEGDLARDAPENTMVTASGMYMFASQPISCGSHLISSLNSKTKDWFWYLACACVSYRLLQLSERSISERQNLFVSQLTSSCSSSTVEEKNRFSCLIMSTQNTAPGSRSGPAKPGMSSSAGSSQGDGHSVSKRWVDGNRTASCMCSRSRLSLELFQASKRAPCFNGESWDALGLVVHWTVSWYRGGHSHFLCLQTSGDSTVSAFPDGDNLFHWVATLTGAKSTVSDPRSWEPYPWKTLADDAWLGLGRCTRAWSTSCHCDFPKATRTHRRQ